MWTKWVCLLCPLAQTRLPWLYQPVFSSALPLFRVPFTLKDERSGGQLRISYIFLWLTGQLFIDQEQIYNGRRIVVWKGGRLSPGTSVLSKASLPWYAQNPLQGCQRFTGSQRDGMLVKTELKRWEWRTSSKPNLPYHRVRYMFPKLSFWEFSYIQLSNTASSMKGQKELFLWQEKWEFKASKEICIIVHDDKTSSVPDLNNN